MVETGTYCINEFCFLPSKNGIFNYKGKCMKHYLFIHVKISCGVE